MHLLSRLAAVAVTVLLAACGSDSGVDQPLTPASTPAPAPTSTPAAGSASRATGSAAATPSTTAAGSSATDTAAASPAPEAQRFTADRVDGGTFDGSSLEGRKAVLWFWAPWCTVCARSAEDVKAAAADLGDVAFVGVAGLSSDADAMRSFVDRHDVGEFTQLADTGGDLYTRFGVTQQHTFVLIDADGTVIRRPAYGRDVDLAGLVRSTFG
jgi:peroxiredoxin